MVKGVFPWLSLSEAKHPFDSPGPDMTSWGSDETIERLREALFASNMGVWDWNPLTGEMQVDARWCAILGLDPETCPMVTETWRSRVHPDDLEACFRAIDRHVRGEAPYYENVHRMRREDGEWVHILDRGRIVARDAEGRAVRFVGMQTDISYFKRLDLHLTEQRMQIAELGKASALCQLAGSIAHEINNPLTVIIGWARALLDLTSRASGKEHAELDVEHIHHLASRIETTTYRVAGTVQTLRMIGARQSTSNLDG